MSLSTEDRLKTETAFKAMEQMGFQAVTLGEKEFLHGLDFLKKRIADHPGLFVSANVLDAATGKPLAQTHVLRTYPDPKSPGKTIRVAITGLMGTDVVPELNSYLGGDASKVRVADPAATAQDLIPKLRQQADLVVMLAHTGMEAGRQLATAVTGIDLMVLGHVPGIYFNETPNVNGATLVSSGDRARYGSQAAITLGTGGEKAIRTRALPLTQAFPENDRMATLRDAYKLRLNQLSGGTVTEKEFTPTAKFFRVDAGNGYLGNAACASCHKAIYEKWSTLSHAKALHTLEVTKNGINAKRPDCLKCHTVGFGQPTGFSVKEYNRSLGGVGCESCHGPGQLHVSLARAGLQKAVMTTRTVPQGSKALCVSCHDATNDPDFNFEKDLEKIKHWGPEFAANKE